MGGQVNIGGVWKDIASVSVNIGGTWKAAQSIKCNIGGVWKDGWSAEPAYTPDVCTGGTVITVGNWDTGQPAVLCFDDSLGTYGKTFGYGIIGDCIGYDFGAGVTRHIRRVRIKHYGAAQMPNSIKLQRSSDNSTWVDVQTLSPASLDETFDISASGAYRYWRLYCNQNMGGAWVIYEIEMMEAA
jgi:hypothetical protein